MVFLFLTIGAMLVDFNNVFHTATGKHDAIH